MRLNYALSKKFLRIDNDMVTSKAWLSLNGTAIQVYLIFWTNARIAMSGGKPGRGGQPYIKNNGDLIFPYNEALDKYGITKPRFKRALAELVEKGFIDIVRPGTLYGVLSKYAISERWRKFGEPDFEKIEMPKRPQSGGFHKKGKSSGKEHKGPDCSNDG